MLPAIRPANPVDTPAGGVLQRRSKLPRRVVAGEWTGPAVAPALVEGRSPMPRVATSPVARLTITGLAILLLGPSGVRPVFAAAPPVPTFGNPTISGIQGYGFEQDLRLDSHGRVYTSVPGSLRSQLSYALLSLHRGQSLK